MNLKEILSEKRSHSEVNIKFSRDEQLRKLVQEHGSENLYCTFTNINKFGINVSTKYNTPTGIYSYPISYVLSLGSKNVPLVSKMSYIQVFKNNTLKENTWIISNKVDDISRRLTTTLNSITGKFKSFKNNKQIWEYMYRFIMGDKFKKYSDDDEANFDNPKNIQPSKFAPKSREYLLAAKIYAIIDNGQGIIYPDEPTQALFLKTEYLELIDTVVYGGKSDKAVDYSKIKGEKNQENVYSTMSAMDAFNLVNKNNRRMVELEPYIMKDPWLAYVYADRYIHHRWPAAERYIMQDPAAACNYATTILKSPWPEAEKVIDTDLTYRQIYKDAFKFFKK